MNNKELKTIMRIKNQYIIILFLLTTLIISALKPVEPSAYQLVQKMFSNAKNVKSLKYTLVKRERINGKLKDEKADIKLVRNPFKIYMKQEYPKAGLEVLYVSGANENKALINTNAFPFVTVSLHPLSSTMREDQHHTLLNAGFDYVVNTLEFLLNKYKTTAPNMVKDAGDITWNGRACHKIFLDNPNFRFIDYTVKKGENIISISEKYKVSAYMILERNKNLNSYEEVKAGQKIRIPTDYALKMVIYLDKQTMLPIMMQIFDDKGLYEQYEFQNLHLNPQFQAAEFTKDYKGYKF